jgi:hypothetical protein
MKEKECQMQNTAPNGIDTIPNPIINEKGASLFGAVSSVPWL